MKREPYDFSRGRFRSYTKRKITKDIYERAMKHNGYISREDCETIFTESELYGYGVYGARAYEENGEYYCDFSLGGFL